MTTTPDSVDEQTPVLANLRHLYENLVSGGVASAESAKSAAEGLLGPVIVALERAQARAATQVATGAPMYSLDADIHGIRARTAEAITGALAFGAQDNNMPPKGHWLTPFWESARTTALSAPQGAEPEYLALEAAVRKVHKAKGRHHSQIAMCDLFDFVGLPNVRPGELPAAPPSQQGVQQRAILTVRYISQEVRSRGEWTDWCTVPEDEYAHWTRCAEREPEIVEIRWLHTSQQAPAAVAAPDVLAALKALFADYKALADSGDAGFWSLEETEVGRQALAAIAAQEGKP